MVVMWPGMAMTMAKLIPSFARRQVSHPLYLSILIQNNTCSILAKLLSSQTSLSAPVSRPLLLPSVASRSLCAEGPLLRISLLAPFWALLKCSVPSCFCAPFSVLSPTEHVERLLSDQLWSPGESLAIVYQDRSLPPSSTLESFGGCLEIALSRIK